MTFVTTRYRLSKPMTAKELERLGRLSTVYGIRGLSFSDQELVVEYDASRMHEAEAIAAVRKAGIAVEPQQPIPSGAFDHAGDFRDFAWPTSGLSPANQRQK